MLQDCILELLKLLKLGKFELMLKNKLLSILLVGRLIDSLLLLLLLLMGWKGRVIHIPQTLHLHQEHAHRELTIGTLR